jgi:hypothetical protein
MELGLSFSLSDLRRNPRRVLDADPAHAVIIRDSGLARWVILPLDRFQMIPAPHGPTRKVWSIDTMPEEVFVLVEAAREKFAQEGPDDD